MNKRLIILFVLLSHTAFANKVYVVLSSDTSIWRNTSGGDVAYTYANEFDFDVFSNPTGVYHDVFEESFRNGHTDSLDNPFKVTWFMHGGGWFQKGTNTDAVSTLFLIKNYWEPELERWGDALEYHFHHFKWTGSEWDQADTFGDTIWDFDWTMSQMIIDHALYTVCFRSGWNYMDNEYQQYLERWIPFRMEGEGWMPDCTPYHPSYSDYSQPGTMKGWEVRHVYMKSFTNSFANNVFNVAHGGKEQVVCVWSHQNEADYVQQIANVDAALHYAAANYPDVQFFYCSGKEAMQKWLQTTDATPPALHLLTTQNGQDVSVMIQTEADTYQEQPWVAARKYSGEYTRLDTVKLSADRWLFSYSTADTDRVVVSVCDIFGNVGLAEVHDGSRCWTTQSEFYHCQPHNIDLETSVGCALLTKAALPYVTSGTLTMEYDAGRSVNWTSAEIATGAVPAGTSIRARFRFADTPAALDAAPWSNYYTGPYVSLPAHSRSRLVQAQALLESTGAATPVLKSLELFYTPLPTAASPYWVLY